METLIKVILCLVIVSASVAAGQGLTCRPSPGFTAFNSTISQGLLTSLNNTCGPPGAKLLTYRQASDDTRPAFLNDNIYYYVTQNFKDFGKDVGEPAIGVINATNDCQEWIYPIKDMLQALKLQGTLCGSTITSTKGCATLNSTSTAPIQSLGTSNGGMDDSGSSPTKTSCSKAYLDLYGANAAFGHSGYDLLSNFFYWVTPDLYGTPSDDVLGYKHLGVCLVNFSLCQGHCLDITDVLIAYGQDMSWFCGLGA